MLRDYYAGLPVPSPDEPSLRDTSDPVDLGFERFVNLAAGVNGQPLSPDRVAWLALWSRAWNILELTRAAYEGDSRIGLMAGDRAAIELLTHLQVILRPVTAETALRNRYGRGAAESASGWREVVERLRTYAAWALGNDHASLVHQQRNLAAIYDPGPARDLRRDEPAARLHEALYGMIPKESPQQLASQKLEARERLDAKLATVIEWLSDPGFADRPALSKLPPTDQAKRVTFFELFDGESLSVASQLRETGVGFAYGQYSLASEHLHGSSLDAFLIVDASRCVFPRLRADTRDALLEGIMSQLTRAWLGLGMMKAHVWDTE